MAKAETSISHKAPAQLRRVMIVDPAPAAQRLLADLLRHAGAGEMWLAESTARAMQIAAAVDPLMIFTELSGERLDGLELTRLIRRSNLACRQAPVIAVTAEATPRTIFGARDAGVHEFLRKPYTIRDLTRRIEAVTLQPRDWIEGIAYIGPDRRRFNSGDYAGPRKRRSDSRHAATTHEARLLQAMKIVHAAVAALESDPAQAVRALRAQMDDLQAAGRAAHDQALMAAAAGFRAYVSEPGPLGIARPAVESHVRTLWSLLPAQMQAEATASRAAA